jgi:hypothetical protein
LVKSQRAPLQHPPSSSAVNASTMSRSGAAPSFFIWSMIGCKDRDLRLVVDDSATVEVAPFLGELERVTAVRPVALQRLNNVQVREEEKRLGPFGPPFPLIAHDDVVLVRLHTAEEDIAFGKAGVAETFGDSIRGIGGPATDVHRIELDDFLVDLQRELLRWGQRCLRVSAAPTRVNAASAKPMQILIAAPTGWWDLTLPSICVVLDASRRKGVGHRQNMPDRGCIAPPQKIPT